MGENNYFRVDFLIENILSLWFNPSYYLYIYFFHQCKTFVKYLHSVFAILQNFVKSLKIQSEFYGIFGPVKIFLAIFQIIFGKIDYEPVAERGWWYEFKQGKSNYSALKGVGCLFIIASNK